MDYDTKIMLLMLRCEYLDWNSSNILTKKGKGYLTPNLWRKYNDIMCKLSKKHKATVMKTLKPFVRKNEIKNEIDKIRMN